MKQSKTTRKALLTSILAMVLCLAMLIGTTFAWFTDSASTGVNQVVSGTLDVVLEMKVGETWVDAQGETLEFVKAAGAPEGEAVLWEPGCTYELPELRIRNNGSLALKYKIEITGITGDNALKDAIDWTIQVGGTAVDLATYEGHLTAKDTTEDSATLTISGHMKESAGNEYQGKEIKNVSITVVATQDTVEYDSYNNTYDATAVYPVISNDALAEAITSAEAGSTVLMSSGTFEFPDGAIPEGVTLSGDGADRTVITTGSNGYTVTSGEVTIQNVTVDGAAASAVGYGGGAVVLKGDGDTIDNCVISGGGTGTYGASIFVGLSSGETAYITNTTISGGFRGIFLGSQQGSVVVDGCDIDAVYPISVDGGGDFTITVTDSKLHGWTSYSAITSASFTNTEFSKGSTGYDFIRPYANTTFTNCTFDANLAIGSGATGITITLNNCVKNGTAVTPENVQELVLDMTGGDGTNLRSCTIIVNGTTVELS